MKCFAHTINVANQADLGAPQVMCLFGWVRRVTAFYSTAIQQLYCAVKIPAKAAATASHQILLTQAFSFLRLSAHTCGS